MSLTPQMFFIVCPLVFLAGFVDSIAGGGGMISIPAYLIAGIPAHFALGTNKLSAASGTLISTIRYCRKGLDIKLIISSVLFALAGSSIGTNLTLLMDEIILKYILLAILPIVAVLVMNKRLLPFERETPDEITTKTYVLASVIAFIIGIYDGFYGPGSGMFLLLGFVGMLKFSIRDGSAYSKILNLSSNIASVTVFIINGKVLFPLGLAAAAFSIAGNFLGSTLVLKRGIKIVRPISIIVIAILFAKLVFDF